MPTVLVAPDSFKGTFSAVEVADAIGRGLAAAGLDADLCPVADGGEGTMETLLASIGGRTVEVDVRDPLGRDLRAPFALIDDGRRALVEMAAASGLALLTEEERDPWAATTYGTGQLIRAAVEAGAEEIMVAVGGSATVDGGRGALQAVADGGGVGDARIVVLCDVTTPWEDCARIYGPQKGADPEMVVRLAERLDALATELPRDPRGLAMTGAAGGLSGGLWAGLGAALEPGAPYVLDAVRFDERLRGTAGVIAGEGRIDEQSVMGKIVGEIGDRALRAGVPLHAIVGRDSVPPQAAEQIALRSVREATTLQEIEATAQRLGRELAAG
ncbi:MAG: glycerate 2-kinase [Solirubrobacteraceae bacterium]|jgi:glycerate kinase|nr:glycerate 2-kinase [Solirubrobacteraceae bacterium]